MNRDNLNDIGTIRYIGPIYEKSGTWYGIELSSQKGKNDGSYKDKRYFTCKPGFGIITTTKYIKVCS
jgi:dynactin complex subunit